MKVDKLIVILRPNDRPLGTYMSEVLGKLTPRGLKVQTCFTTTTAGEGIVEGQQHTVDINTDCQLSRTDVTNRQSNKSDRAISRSDNHLNTTDRPHRSFKISATYVFDWQQIPRLTRRRSIVLDKSHSRIDSVRICLILCRLL
jgi:hypothetical protein